MENNIMTMSEKIRVKIDPSYKKIYDGLKGYALGDFHEIFFLCTCLGYKNKLKKKLNKKEDCFWSSTITPDEWYGIYSLYLNEFEMKFSELADDQLVIDMMQEYANGGMEYLISEFLEDFLKKDQSGKYFFETKQQLPKELLMSMIDWC